MDGVTILNEIVTPIEEISNLIICILVLVILTISGGVVGGILEYKSFSLSNLPKIVRIILVAIAGATVGFCVGTVIFVFIAKFEQIGEKTTYEVTIDDTVSMTEFNNRYNIVEQRGKIYVIEEKTPQKDDTGTS